MGAGRCAKARSEREEEKDKSGEESRSQTTENSLSFQDYLADRNVVISQLSVYSQEHCLLLGPLFCQGREKRNKQNNLTFHLLSDLFRITRDT